MLGVASGAILVPLNSTMLAVALPGVMDEYGLGADEVSSLVSLYLGAVAVTLPAAGALADRFGAWRLFVAGVVGFGIASLVAAFSDSFVVLGGARVMQAAGGALVSTSSTALIRMAAPASRRGEAFGVFDMLVSVSAAVGPFVGGVLVAAFGWRSLFTLAAPIAAVAAVAVWRLHRPGADGRGDEEGRSHPRPIDLPGLALLALAILAVVTGLRNPGAGWAALAIAAVLLVAFVAVERRTRDPAVDLGLFARPAFSAAVVGVLGSTVVLHGTFLLVPILVERLLRGAPTDSGLVLLGIAAVSAIPAQWAGRASDRLGRRRVAVAGSLVMTIGLAGLAAPIGVASLAGVAALLAVVGLGMGIAGAPRQAAALEVVESARAGMAAGTYYTGRYLGGVVGASLGGAVLAGGVTASAMSTGFGLLAAVGVGVALASLGLAGRPGARNERPARV
jgi:EmrB/QacA subfamily drug resistance transporter